MSLDLVAVQLDGALLDALARRTLPIETDIDPVVGLLAALAADVDEGLLDVAGPETSLLIPEQSGDRARPGTVSPLPLAPPPVGRRHVARAVAAMVVTAVVLSISGVAAAVTGDPLTPYKRVIDVVRGEYNEVVPKGFVAPKPTVVPLRTKTVTVALRAAGQARYAVASRASRVAEGRQRWDRHLGDRKPSGRQGRDRHGRDSRHRYGSAGAGTAHSGGNPSGQHWAGHGSWTGPRGHVGGNTGGRGGRSGVPRQ